MRDPMVAEKVDEESKEKKKEQSDFLGPVKVKITTIVLPPSEPERRCSHNNPCCQCLFRQPDI